MLLAVAAVANEVNHDVIAASATCARDAKGRCIDFACDDCFLHPPDRLHTLYMRSLPSPCNSTEYAKVYYWQSALGILPGSPNATCLGDAGIRGAAVRGLQYAAFNAYWGFDPTPASFTQLARYLVANSTHGSEKVASKRTSDMCACTRKAAFHLPNCSRAVYTRLALPRIAAAMVAELHAIFPAVKYEGERCAADRLHATVDPS